MLQLICLLEATPGIFSIIETEPRLCEELRITI